MALFRLGRRSPGSERGSDADTLRKLEALGAKLSRARHVIHVLTFGSEVAARDAAAAIERAGWEVTVIAPQFDGGEWEVRAEGERVVDGTTVRAFRSWFERVAAGRDGNYSGWEAAAKP